MRRGDWLREALLGLGPRPTEAEVPRDLVFDDEPVEHVLYGEDSGPFLRPKGASRASIYHAAHEYFAQILHSSQSRDDAGLLDCTVRLLEERHPVPAGIFRDLLPVLTPLPELSLADDCPWNANAVLGRLCELSAEYNHQELQVTAAIAHGLLLATRDNTPEATRVWQQQRKLATETDREIDQLVYRTFILQGERFWRLPRDADDGRFRDLADLLPRCLLSGSNSREPPREPAAATAFSTGCGSYLRSVSAHLERLASRFRDEHNEDQLNKLRYNILATGLSQGVAGDDHPYTLMCLNMLIRMVQDEGEHEAAVALSRHAVEQRKKELGPLHPAVATSLNNLGLSLYSLGRLDEAAETLQLATKSNRNWPYPWYWLARVQEQAAGDVASQLQAWEAYRERALADEEYRAQAIGRRRIEEASGRIDELRLVLDAQR